MPIPQFRRTAKTRKREPRRAPPGDAPSTQNDATSASSPASAAETPQGEDNCALLQPAAEDGKREVPALLARRPLRR